jgi:C4-dicarboxylate-specific signal transduction histidine kinase
MSQGLRAALLGRLSVLLTAVVLAGGSLALLLYTAAEVGKREQLAQTASVAVGVELGRALERVRDTDAQGAVCRAVVDRLRAVGLPIESMAVVGRNGRTIFEQEEGLASSVRVEVLHRAAAEQRVLARGRIGIAPLADSGGQVLGAVVVRVPRRPRPWLPFALLLGFVGGALFALRRATRLWVEDQVLEPIELVGRATEDLAERRFDTRIGRLGAPRELEELASSFDALAAALGHYDEQSRAQLRAIEASRKELLNTREALILNEKMASVGRVSAGLAHEVGNPLAAVLGNVRLLRSGRISEAQQDDLLRRSEQELERIHHIVGDLLDYARPRERDMEAVEVAPLVEEVLTLVAERSELASVELRADGLAGLPPVRAREGRLRQVLLNLVMNAAGAVAEDDAGEVEISGAAEEGWVLLQVRDNGPGIPEDLRDRVFEPFFTAREGGRGLGLAVSLGIIESFDGTLRYRDRRGGGAVFELRMHAWTGS